MTATAAKTMTFAEFEQLPDPQGFRYELRHGELVEVPPPKHEHRLIQRALRTSLEALAGDYGVVDLEYGFRVQDLDYRVPDVSVISAARWAAIPRKGYLSGAPELVVEVLSPSNTASEMYEKELLCLENGCREFWVVDPDAKLVRVSTLEGIRSYRTGDQIPLFFGGSISVDSIFA